MITGLSITKKFDGILALSNMDIHIKKGSVYGLVGPNGAGKTTFIKALMSIYKLDGGTIYIDKEENISDENLKQRIVYISDDLYFYPGYSIKQTADFYASVYENWDNNTFLKLQDIFKIDINRKVRKLSKGMKKQVAFMMGISAKPDIMVLDEPVDGLDPVMRRNIMNVILQEVEKRNMTVLISSHNLRELEDICDHVGIMHDGKIVIEKSLDDVKGNIHKLQVAFDAFSPAEFEAAFEILHKEEYGSVYQYIIRGDGDAVLAKAKEFKPILLDLLPLSLEEVFIYELGGIGYELKNEIL
ncbi:MAG: ABC transporter ATP-binding protein [Firmicutes bacterium]|nr:ABC transporter ATP-binding protein [Bacillota bacterium]HAL63334.1 ABC transporter [Clostridiales bacterium]